MDAQKPMLHSRAHIEAGDIVILYMVRFHLFEVSLSSGSWQHDSHHYRSRGNISQQIRKVSPWYADRAKVWLKGESLYMVA